MGFYRKIRSFILLFCDSSLCRFYKKTFLRAIKCKLKLTFKYLLTKLKLILKNFYVIDIVRIVNKYARVAQLDRAFGYEPKGREFESCHARIKYRITIVIRYFIRVYGILGLHTAKQYTSSSASEQSAECF